ncbi:hypothetical protein [Membranihabitans maritimus]|uniref:hypothetical protein n=1 Tax=Membranihabitans maritimus TaxID=2904244 RepID=UPI001F2AE6C3|nr:hypothetical protein [Membranihabitans maritimus]
MLNYIKKYGLHIFTIIVFGLLISKVFSGQDSLSWTLLFSAIALNAILYMFDKGISIIAWLICVCCLLGMTMSLPIVFSWFTNGMPAFWTDSEFVPHESRLWSFCYFGISCFFGLLQIQFTS